MRLIVSLMLLLLLVASGCGGSEAEGAELALVVEERYGVEVMGDCRLSTDAGCEEGGAEAIGRWRCTLAEPREDAFGREDTVWCVTRGYPDDDFAQAELAFPRSTPTGTSALSC